jgi:ornithine cyclodeaminase/alanine dehydrogenase-like protein (mu-crystallin family)
MRLLVLSAEDVHALLDPADCADAMRLALIALQTGAAEQPLRTVVRPEGAAGLVGLMPSYLSGTLAPDTVPPDAVRPDTVRAYAGRRAHGLKAICITPSNPAAGLDTHQGVVLLSSGETGEPLALLNASALTEIRTAAVSVVATDLLARKDADVLAIIGAGVQARAHAFALVQWRAPAQIRIAGRDPQKAEWLAARLRKVIRGPVTVCPTAQDAVAGASIVVTATSSAEPVLRGEWLEPGMHINAVGACLPTMRELDTAAMAAGVLFADSRESLFAEAGDYVQAAADGGVGPASVRAELGEVLTEARPGRDNADEITIFESLGLAIEDLAAAVCAYDRAVATGEGNWVDF